MHLTSRLNKAVLVLAFAAVSSFAVQGIAQEKYRAPKSSDGELAWKFKEGQVLKMKMTQNVKTVMQIAGQEMETTNDSINEMTLKIKSVDSEGVATADNTLDRMLVNTSAPGMSIKYDTADSEAADGAAEQMAQVLAPMIGPVISQKMRPNGEIFDVKVPKEMFAGAKSANPMMSQMFNEASIKEMTSKSSLVFPKKSPEVGGKWENESEISMGPAKVKNKIEYEYLGVSDVDGKPHHVIQAVMKMKFPDGIMGMEVDISDEDTKTMFFFDGVAGRLTKSELDQNMTMNFSGPQEFSQTMKQTTKMEVKQAK